MDRPPRQHGAHLTSQRETISRRAPVIVWLNTCVDQMWRDTDVRHLGRGRPPDRDTTSTACFGVGVRTGAACHSLSDVSLSPVQGHERAVAPLAQRRHVLSPQCEGGTHFALEPSTALSQDAEVGR